VPVLPKDYSKTPQELVTEFWDKYFSKKPGKVTSVFPRSLYASLLPPPNTRGSHKGVNAAESYEKAAKQCREEVARIVRECNRTNEKFTDADFDIEADQLARNCLNGLTTDENDSPGSVHRLDWIFEKPEFTKEGYSSSDIKQGCAGNCWWLAAVASIAHRKDLMNKICVARNEECGVYGFVFYRDGEWISTVVDDNLYLKSKDFGADYDVYDPNLKKAKDWRKANQTGSEALYFGQCSDPNETWLPLMEKAYAKVHGDYSAISGGFSGEGIEDMTGGVSTTVISNRVLSKDKLWKELACSDGDLVFACGADRKGWADEKAGLALGHAYSILKATEEVDEDGNKVRLVQIRNPWGERGWSGLGEWNGPWSDGSKEWTPYWLKKLKHQFGDDGVFWMAYEDMLETFQMLDRTRVFDEKWTVVQQWTSVNVGWVAGYLTTKFIIEVKKAGTVVVVLNQLDERYFQGLEGQYTFNLHFLLQKEGGDEHICRVRPAHDWERRQVSCEVNLEPGRYEVLPKITVTRDTSKPMVEDVIAKYADENPVKLRQIGMLYDLAHAKGGIPDEDEEVNKKKEEKKKKEELKKLKKERKKQKEKEKRRKEKREAAAAAAVAAAEAAAAAVAAVAAASETKTEEKSADSAKEENKEEDKFEDAVEKPKEEEAKADDKKDEKKDEKEQEKKEEKKEEPKDEKKEEPTKAADEPAAKSEEKKEDEKKEAAAEEKPAVPTVVEEEDDSDDDEEEEEEEETPEPPVDGRIPWNAVCVIGLRVYSQDKDITIEAVKTKNDEEGATLVVDSHAAGATL